MKASIEVREAGKRAVTQIQSSNPNFLSHEFDLDEPGLISPTSLNTADTAYDTKSLSNQDITSHTRHSLSQPQSPRARSRVDNFTAGYHRSTSIITQLEKSKVLLKMSDVKADKPLCILHYNDVYNVDATTEVEPIGGAARFCTAVKTFREEDPLILFSGDIFSPSMRKFIYTSGRIEYELMVQLSFSEHFHPGRTNGASPQCCWHPLCSIRQS